MAERRAPARNRPVRHSLAAALLSFLPLLAFAGVLAPGLIEVAYEEPPDLAPQHKGTIIFRPVRLTRPPLLVTRGAGRGFLLEFLDIEALFSDSRYRGELGQRLAELQGFPAGKGDMIVIDDVDAVDMSDELFEDLLSPSFVLNDAPLWDPKVFDVIPPLFAIGNNVRYDDFPDPGFIPGEVETDTPVIPEPSTALLLGSGLVALALAKRRSF
jgi:hypothetical protein